MANGSPQKVIVNDRAAKRLRQGHVWVYASDVLNDAVVVACSGGVNVTVPGPMNLDHEYVSTLPRGNASSVALPVRDAFAGKRID